MRKSLEQLRASDLPHCTAEDLFDGDVTTEDRAALDDYLWRFVPPKDGDMRCPGCDAKLTGLFGTFTWRIVHGEGCCGNCGYPARAYHREIGTLEFFQFPLPYHPAFLKRVGHVQ